MTADHLLSMNDDYLEFLAGNLMVITGLPLWANVNILFVSVSIQKIQKHVLYR